jgi:hypothetical protein
MPRPKNIAYTNVQSGEASIPIKTPTIITSLFSVITNLFRRARVFGDGFGTLRDGVLQISNTTRLAYLGEFTRKDKSDSGLDFAR